MHIRVLRLLFALPLAVLLVAVALIHAQSAPGSGSGSNNAGSGSRNIGSGSGAGGGGGSGSGGGFSGLPTTTTSSATLPPGPTGPTGAPGPTTTAGGAPPPPTTTALAPGGPTPAPPTPAPASVGTTTAGAPTPAPPPGPPGTPPAGSGSTTTAPVPAPPGGPVSGGTTTTARPGATSAAGAPTNRSANASATTMVAATTTTTAAPLPPLSAAVDRAAEERARGVLTLCAALMTPVLGPSVIFETTRALAVFPFARCSHQAFREVLETSTGMQPWPEAIIPMQIGGINSGHLRGVFVSNLLVVPLIAWFCTVLYGFFAARKHAGQWHPPPGPKPTSGLGNFWLAYCEWMYWGSTLTVLTVLFAFGFDGAMSALFAIFGTSVTTSDEGGDFVLCMIYVVVVPIFLYRVASTIYNQTPSRYFTTPGMVRIKQGKKALRRLPEKVADFFGSKWGAWVVTGHWCWRPGSAKSRYMLREVACLYRRFLGPHDEDRSVMAVEMMAAHQEFLKKQKAAAEAAAAADAAKKAAAAAAAESAAKAKADDAEGKTAEEANADGSGADAKNDGFAGEKQEKNEAAPTSPPAAAASAEAATTPTIATEESAAAAAAAAVAAPSRPPTQEEEDKKREDEYRKKAAALVASGAHKNKGYCASIHWGLQLRRIVYTDFFFFEFIFVFFIAMFKGLARVSLTPDGCFSNAMGAAVFNLFFFVFLLAVRPFAVPMRNVLALVSSFFAMLANFLAASSADNAEAAAGLATFAAIFPFIEFGVIAVPRLLMRFVWGLQHAPGKQIPLRDPSKPPPPPPSEEELEKQRKAEAALSLKAAVHPEQFAKETAEQQRRKKEEQEAAERRQREQPLLSDAEAAAILGVKPPAAGPLTQLAHIFFPPPPGDTRSIGTADALGDDDADSFGDDDDDIVLPRRGGAAADDDESDDEYLDRMVYQRYSNPSNSRSASAGGGNNNFTPREMEMSNAMRRLENVHEQLAASQAQQQQQHRAMTTQFVPQVYSPPRGGGGMTPLTGGGGARGMSTHDVSPTGAGNDPRIAQQTALAQLLHHIVEARRKVLNSEREALL